MKLHDWNHPLARWDRYKAFHMSLRRGGVVDTSGHYAANAPFVQFDTGELICNLCSPGPEDRGEYAGLNVGVYGTTDSTCPTLYMADGTRVPTAWLDCGGMQHLLVDHDLRRAYRLDDMLDVDRIPQRFVNDPHQRRWQTVRAYYPGPGREPITGQVTVRPPFKPTADEREHVETQVATARATLTLTDHAVTRMNASSPLAPERLLAVSDWRELSNEELAQLYHNGLGRRTIRLPYLLTEPGHG